MSKKNVGNFLMFLNPIFFWNLLIIFSSCFPQQNSCCANIKIYHIFFVKTYVAPEIFTYDALPGWVKSVIEIFFQIFGQSFIILLFWLIMIKSKFNSSNLHVFADVTAHNFYILIGGHFWNLIYFLKIKLIFPKI